LLAGTSLGDSTTGANQHLFNMVQIAETNGDSEVSMWKSALRSYRSEKGGNEWFTKNGLIKINRQIVDILKDIGVDKIKEAINNHIPTGADRNRALELWSEGKGAKLLATDLSLVDKSEWGIFKMIGDPNTDYRNGDVAYIETMVGTYGDPANRLKSKFKVVPIDKVSDGTSKKATWPWTQFNDEDFFELMQLLFPRATYQEGSTTFDSNPVTSNYGKDKSWNIHYSGFGDDLFAGITDIDARRAKNIAVEALAKKNLETIHSNNWKLL